MGDRCGKCTFRILPVEYIRIYGFYQWILPVEYSVIPLSTYGGRSDSAAAAAYSGYNLMIMIH